ncbi:MAG TPA: hypothetical protein VGG72_15375 [Bryobacteraceae bacterium]|jgi:hypothetical protein
MSLHFQRPLPRAATWAALLLCAPFGHALAGQSLDDRRVGVFAGYTFANAQDPDDSGLRLSFSGGDIGVYVTQNRWLRWTGDFTAAGNGGILGPTILYGLAGPEFTKRTGRAIFFGHALFGYGEVDGGLFSANKSGVAMAFGGGVDLRLNKRFNLRVVQLDYLPSHFGGRPESIFGPTGPVVTSWENNLRVSVGVVVKFGHTP